MCTAIIYGNHAGRNLDVYKSYDEEIIVTPRNYSLALRREDNIGEHYSMIGMGTVSRGYPLYFDAANEHGLYAAGLNYVGYARYLPPKSGRINLAPFELIPYILAKCKTVSEAKVLLTNINLTDIPFSRELPSAELHWLFADKDCAIVAEPDEDGLSIYDNPVGVLTNNPEFPYHLFNLNNYPSISNKAPKVSFKPGVELKVYSEGMGAIGLPGDASSASRFIRTAFHKSFSVDESSPAALFHLLSSAAMPYGSVKVGELYERTEYASAISLNNLTYHYRTYNGAATAAVRLFSENLDTQSLIRYPLLRTDPIYQN